MELSEPDVRQFYDLLWSLQHYVNQKHQVHPDVTTVEQYALLTSQDKCEVGDVIYANLDIIDDFVRENPRLLSDDQLEIVARWKNLVEGKFFIERLLKRYAVFIGDNKVYGVLGLYDPIEDLLTPIKPPVYVQTALLPFKGRIVYDGNLRFYSISFGGGMKRMLKEQYMTAKQNDRIITTLEPEKQDEQQVEPATPARDYTPELDEMAKVARKLRGGQDQPAVYTPAFKLVRESIKLARAAVKDPKDLKTLNARLKKARSALRRTQTVLNRTEL